jgi:hypothetical protein
MMKMTKMRMRMRMRTLSTGKGRGRKKENGVGSEILMTCVKGIDPTNMMQQWGVRWRVGGDGLMVMIIDQ